MTASTAVCTTIHEHMTRCWRAQRWRQRPLQGISSTGTTSTAEGYQRPASISICLSLHPCDHDYYCAKRATKTNSTIQQSNRSRSQREPASNRSQLRISPLILYLSYGNLIFRILRYHIRATGALGGSGVTCVPLICSTEPLADSGALLIRATLTFGSGVSASGTALLRFRPRFALSAVASSASASSASGIALLHFRPRLPLSLASLAASFSARFARASSRSL